MIGLGHVLHLTNTKATEISELCGVSPQTVNKWIQSIKPLPPKYSAILEAKFNIPFSLLYREVTTYDRIIIDVLLHKKDVEPHKLGKLTSDLLAYLRG